jgi:hypothetical protein
MENKLLTGNHFGFSLTGQWPVQKSFSGRAQKAAADPFSCLFFFSVVSFCFFCSRPFPYPCARKIDSDRSEKWKTQQKKNPSHPSAIGPNILAKN